MTSRESQQHGSAPSGRRSAWFDPRFAIGILLVAASVVGVGALVRAANASATVLAARAAMTPGQKVHESDFVPTSVRVGRTAALYLQPSDVPSAGLIVTRPVSTGELVAHTAVGSEAGKSLTSIVVSVNGALAASIVPWSRIDLWSSEPADVTAAARGDEPSTPGAPGAFTAPTVLVSSAIVVRLVDQKSVVASSGSSVEVLLPKSQVAAVLDAIANGAVLSVLPVDLPLGQ
jgi:hypothetical protein